MKAWSPNHWTAMELPSTNILREDPTALEVSQTIFTPLSAWSSNNGYSWSIEVLSIWPSLDWGRPLRMAKYHSSHPCQLQTSWRLSSKESLLQGWRYEGELCWPHCYLSKKGLWEGWPMKIWAGKTPQDSHLCTFFSLPLNIIEFLLFSIEKSC